MVFKHSPVIISQIFNVQSSDPEQRKFESLDQTKHDTLDLCPINFCSIEKFSVFQIIIVSSEAKSFN